MIYFLVENQKKVKTRDEMEAFNTDLSDRLFLDLPRLLNGTRLSLTARTPSLKRSIMGYEGTGGEAMLQISEESTFNHHNIFIVKSKATAESLANIIAEFARQAGYHEITRRRTFPIALKYYLGKIRA